MEVGYPRLSQHSDNAEQMNKLTSNFLHLHTAVYPTSASIWLVIIGRSEFVWISSEKGGEESAGLAGLRHGLPGVESVGVRSANEPVSGEVIG